MPSFVVNFVVNSKCLQHLILKLSQDGIKMLLDKIENLEAEITKLRNLADNTANEDDRQLRDEVAKINYIIFGDDYPPSDHHAEH